jgi:hypothetical protein
MSPLDHVLKVDIAKALRSGTVPASGLEHFAVGLDPLAAAFREDFAHVGSGRSGYRFLRGAYGSGKTFFSTLVASEALEAGFLTSHVVISGFDTPLFKLAGVYRRICGNLCSRSHSSGALQSVIDRWLHHLEDALIEVDGIDESSPDFEASVAARVEQALSPVGDKAGRLVSCLRAYHRLQAQDDYANARALLDWMAGEPKVSADIKKLAGVTGTLDNTDALVFLRGLLEVIRAAGHKGLVLVLDEVETVTRQRRPERLKSLEVLRGLVDALDKNEFPGLLLIVTGTPELFEGAQSIEALEPLYQRLRVDFHPDRPDNLRLPQVRLHPFDEARLLLVARRVKEIYPATHPDRIARRVDESLIQSMVSHLTEGFGGRIEIVPRLFLREFVQVLDLVDLHDYDPRAQYRFDMDRVAEGLNDEERACLQGQARDLYL